MSVIDSSFIYVMTEVEMFCTHFGFIEIVTPVLSCKVKRLSEKGLGFCVSIERDIPWPFSSRDNNL